MVREPRADADDTRAGRVANRLLRVLNRVPTGVQPGRLQRTNPAALLAIKRLLYLR
jgi:hypothetical protein